MIKIIFSILEIFCDCHPLHTTITYKISSMPTRYGIGLWFTTKRNTILMSPIKNVFR